jgi:hypothetical protein
MMAGKMLMVCLGFANGDMCEDVGKYLLRFDPDYGSGLGRAYWTDNASEAMLFKNAAEFFTFWKQESKLRPKRRDGKPNRPLTAYSITHADPAELNDPSLLMMVRAAHDVQGV